MQAHQDQAAPAIQESASSPGDNKTSLESKKVTQETTRQSPAVQHSIASRVLTPEMQFSLAPLLSVGSTGTLICSSKMFQNLWMIKSRADFKCTPDLKKASRFYQMAAIHAGTIPKPFGYWNFDKLAKDTLEFKEQFASIKFNHSLESLIDSGDIYSDKEKTVFLDYCEKTLHSTQPDFRIIKGLMNLIISKYYTREFNTGIPKWIFPDYYGEEKDSTPKSDSEKQIKIKIQKLLLRVIAKCSDNKIKGEAYFGLFLIERNLGDLQKAMDFECAAALFWYAGKQFRSLFSPDKSTQVSLAEIINLVDKAARLGYGPACCLLGVCLLNMVKPKIKMIELEYTSSPKTIDHLLVGFSSNQGLQFDIQQAIPALKEKYLKSARKANSSSRINFAFFESLFTQSEEEIAIEKFAIDLLKTAANQGSIIAIRALIVYYAEKHDVDQTVEYLLKDNTVHNQNKWFAFACAFREGGYLDLNQFVKDYDPRDYKLPEHPAQHPPTRKPHNIKKNPEKALFCFKKVFRNVVNDCKGDTDGALEFIRSFTNGAPINPRSCIPKDPKQAEELLKIAWLWAAKFRKPEMMVTIYNIVQNGQGCLPQMPELAQQLARLAPM